MLSKKSQENRDLLEEVCCSFYRNGVPIVEQQGKLFFIFNFLVERSSCKREEFESTM
jgi:hypothetical protein